METIRVGGQAVIEGVMMRCREKLATAVRKGKKIILKQEEIHSITEKHHWLKIPLLRGPVFVFEMLVVGMRSLTWSASQQGEEFSEAETGITFAVSILLATGLFVLLPYWLAGFFSAPKTISFNIIDGAIRLLLFLMYLYGIGLWKDIKRVFQYHGAEHKAVNCYEAKEKLTVKNCKKMPTFHPRCGTSLILYVVILSIILFALIRTGAWYYNISLRLILIPAIISIAYELLMLTAGRYDTKIVKLLISPGKWTQALTTREPDEKQLEVAITALKKVLPKQKP